jgi:outer membrane receptor for ferrienterochelin and colicins
LRYYGEETGNTLTAEAAPGYTTADLGGSYDLTDALTLNASLNNLTDKRLDDETYGTVNYGRTLWGGVTYNF